VSVPDRLIAAKYGKRKYGIAAPGGPAFLFIAPAPGEDFIDEDLQIISEMLSGYNAARESKEATDEPR
jgi:hypothetical protein